MYLQASITRINNIPVPSVVPDYSTAAPITGYQLKITGNTTFTLSPGSARAYTCNSYISYPSFQVGSPALLEIDISNVGALGCYPISFDDASFADDVSLGVYVIADDSGLNPVTAVVATADNFLLPGYNLWRRVGTVYVSNSTGHLVPMTQSGSGNDRKYLLREIISGFSYGPTTFFTLDLSTGVAPCNPYFTTDVITRRALLPASTTDYGAISEQNTGTTANLSLAIKSPASGHNLQDNCTTPVAFIDGDTPVNEVYVTLVGAGALFEVEIVGWEESMGLQAI